MQAIKLEHRESQSMHIAQNITCLCFILYLASDMGLRYLTFMGRNLEIRKKPTSVRIMNSAVSIVLVFSVIMFLLIIFQRIVLDELCFLWIFPRWTVILAHTSAGEYKSTQIFKFIPIVWIIKEYSQFVRRDPQNIIAIFQDHGTDPHGSITLWMHHGKCKMLRSTLYYEAFTMRQMNLGKQLNAKALHEES